ncbi:hypothetical protein [Streptacidiphilus carbonis]|uniref:hypothetical protein n=1 Tax=Streptacidiphilus carbonis TaxID=105422 RepID=UPI0005A62DEA|nr:hypothetical protein [Streptacidiphilus carbonis]
MAAATLAALLSTVATACTHPGGTGGSADGSAGGGSRGGRARNHRPSRLDPVVQRLAPFLERHFADSYTTVVVDGPHNRLIVYRVPNPALDTAARSVAGHTRLSFIDSHYAYNRQHELLERIGADRGYWRRQGIKVTSWTASDGVRCAVWVTTVHSTGADQRAFDARYGTGLVEVTRVGPGRR